MLKQFDERRDLAVPGRRPIALAFCVEHFIRCASQCIEDRGAFHVALSGGSTPKAIYHILTSDHFADKVNWEKVHLYWSDERCVPPTDSESNYKMTMDAGFDRLPIPKEQIHRMEGELDPEEAAERYAKVLPQMMDLILLGMGDDGHTASLFPDTEALDEDEKSVVANYVPQKKSWRLTLTIPYINSARGIVFYVFGKEKKSMIRQVLRRAEKYPAGRVGRDGRRALWICDTDAWGKV
ncbi:MAG: 6-phosphogluconolactonase [Chlamydiales bacterium]|nr:6-phosphogluconolactonase [Chlamydiales bacterium]